MTFSRLVISNAGTAGGAGDWLVHDIEIDGVSQLEQKDLSGIWFSTRGVAAGRGTTCLVFDGVDVIERDSEVIVTVSYVGSNPDGCPFFGSVLGEAPQQRPTILPIRKRVRDKATIVALFERSVKVEALDITKDAAGWQVDDIRIDGTSQFNYPGPIPGGLFAVTAIDGLVTWSAGRRLEIDVQSLEGAEAAFEGQLLCTVVREDYALAPPPVRTTIWTDGGDDSEEVVALCAWRE